MFDTNKDKESVEQEKDMFDDCQEYSEYIDPPGKNHKALVFRVLCRIATAFSFLSSVLVIFVIILCVVSKAKGLSPIQVGKSLLNRSAMKQSGDLDSVVNSRTESKMEAIETLVDSYYYLNEVPESKLEDGVYKGMIEALGDKYAEYYTAKELQEVLNDNEGIFYGVGAYISIDQELEVPFFSGIMEEGAAAKADLHAGDLIMEVNGESTFGMTLTEVVSRVRGEEGTTVHLKMYRDGDYFELDVVREKVNMDTVKSEMLTDEIGYIAIREFDDITVDQFTEAYATIKGKNAKALILDLRGNPGGLLDAVVAIGRQILPEGLIVYTEDKSGHREEYACDGTREIKIPMVVLVDSGSASASEILTGAIKDYGIGTIMGTKTYGKGIVQTIFSLSDGSAVKMTISAYYTPKGNNIHEVGIEPDIEVPFDAEAYYNAENSVDNQLEAAKEYLQDKLH